MALACEQAPKWGIGRKEKSAGWASGAWYGPPLFSELDFCPHLRACSQAIMARMHSTREGREGRGYLEETVCMRKQDL